MGYTHYWDNAPKAPKAETVKVFKKHFNAMFIAMGGNGVIEINENNATRILFNGRDNDAHETMVIDFTGNGKWDFCKTACKPYDTLVVACLILAKEMGIIADWSSDGDDENGDFDAGKKLLNDTKHALLNLNNEPVLNHYMVELKLQIGEYEKYANIVVLALNEKDAGKYALALECHGNASFTGEDMVEDMGGEMAYMVRKVTKLPKSHVNVLKKHFNIFKYDENFIKDMVDNA